MTNIAEFLHYEEFSKLVLEMLSNFFGDIQLAVSKKNFDIGRDVLKKVLRLRPCTRYIVPVSRR